MEEYDATQPAEDASAFAATQPADDARPAGAHFTREGDGGGAPKQFSLDWRHGAKVELGRLAPAGGVQRVVLCAGQAQGVSRQHAFLTYDQKRGVVFTICCAAEAAVTFVN